MRTKEAYDYSSVDDRFLSHDGCIVDVGCAGWDMFASLVGKKRIIGVDPFEEPKEGYEFWKGIVSPISGSALMDMNGDESKITDFNGVNVFSITWKRFCRNFNVTTVSILKLNIEGAEYPLLHSMDTDDFEKIDQIMVSFHDWINPKWRNLTDCAMCLLEHNGFELAHTASQYGWHLYVKSTW